MTLGDFFTWSSQRPGLMLGYFVAIPLVAVLAMFFSRGHAHESPWKYLFSVLIYLVSIPGIFAITLSIYFFLFERKPLMEANLYTQVLPVLSMIATIFLIRKQVSLDRVPGFDRLSGLISIIAVLMGVMWIIDKTHIFSITFLPLYVVILLLIGGFFVVRMGLKRLTK
jgi:hypothetical protein